MAKSGNSGQRHSKVITYKGLIVLFRGETVPGTTGSYGQGKIDFFLQLDGSQTQNLATTFRIYVFNGGVNKSGLYSEISIL